MSYDDAGALVADGTEHSRPAEPLGVRERLRDIRNADIERGAGHRLRPSADAAGIPASPVRLVSMKEYSS
jgi:hypothetical protein